MRALVVRQARAEVINGFNTCIEMIKMNSKTGPAKRPNQIEIAFAEPEPTRPIRLLVTNACAVRGDAGRMSIGDSRATARHGSNFHARIIVWERS